jgi:hypothetical protein
LQMLWRKMSVAHCHNKTGVAKNLLQCDYISALIMK